MNSDLYGQPSRIALMHPVPARSRAIAEALHQVGHQVRLVLPGPRAVAAVQEYAPELVIAHENLAEEFAASDPVFGVPLICLTEPGSSGGRMRSDAMLHEPVDPEVIRVCAGGLLRAHQENRKLRRKVKDLGSLYKLSWAFSLEGGPEHLYSYIAEQTALMLDAEAGLVLTYDAAQRRIVAQPRGHGLPADVVAALSYPVDGESSKRWNFRSNGPLLSTDAASDPRLLPDVVAQLGVRSLVIVPMTTGQSIVGLLAVADRSGGRVFDDEDMRLLLSAASLAAVAMDNLALHETLKEANASLKESDRLKNQFVGMVAHDFRRPLTVVRGFAEIVMVDEPPFETVKEYMSAIIEESDGLSRLTDDMLLLTKLETANIEFRWSEVEVATLLREVIPADRAGHSVELDVPSDVPPVVVDAQRLRQVLSNLVSNAIKYSPDGGTITLRCRVQNEQVTIEVSDQGLGIPRDQQDGLFQRFKRVQTDEHLAISGTGLGLYISRLIVEGHGGRVWVQSEPGQGSTFCVRLPRDARASRDQPQPEATKVSPARLSGPITMMFQPLMMPGTVGKATGSASRDHGAAKARDTAADRHPMQTRPTPPDARTLRPGPRPARVEPATPDDSQTTPARGAELRQSARIRKMIPVRINYNGGTLTTYTAVINRHGALIVCAVPVAPGTRLQITCLAGNQTAEFEVVRCSDEDAGLYQIGVHLMNDQDFWGARYDPTLVYPDQIVRDA